MRKFLRGIFALLLTLVFAALGFGITAACVVASQPGGAEGLVAAMFVAPVVALGGAVVAGVLGGFVAFAILKRARGADVRPED